LAKINWAAPEFFNFALYGVAVSAQQPARFFGGVAVVCLRRRKYPSAAAAVAALEQHQFRKHLSRDA